MVARAELPHDSNLQEENFPASKIVPRKIFHPETKVPLTVTEPGVTDIPIGERWALSKTKQIDPNALIITRKYSVRRPPKMWGWLDDADVKRIREKQIEERVQAKSITKLFK